MNRQTKRQERQRQTTRQLINTKAITDYSLQTYRNDELVYDVLCVAIIVLMGMASTSLTSNTSPTAMKFAPMKYKGFVSGLVGAGMGWTAFYMAPLIRTLQASIGITGTLLQSVSVAAP